MIKLFALPMILVLLAVSTSGCIKKYSKTPEEPDIVITGGDETTEPEVDEVTGTETATGEEIPKITDEELDRGFYYGTKDQKKAGTPDEWVYIEAGRSSMWKKP